MFCAQIEAPQTCCTPTHVSIRSISFSGFQSQPRQLCEYKNRLSPVCVLCTRTSASERTQNGAKTIACRCRLLESEIQPLHVGLLCAASRYGIACWVSRSPRRVKQYSYRAHNQRTGSRYRIKSWVRCFYDRSAIPNLRLLLSMLVRTLQWYIYHAVNCQPFYSHIALHISKDPKS